MAGLQEDTAGLQITGDSYKRTGESAGFLPSQGRELEGHVDTSFPGSEFREWLLGKLTPNPDKPSCSPG